jgi:hypothetical protein
MTNDPISIPGDDPEGLGAENMGVSIRISKLTPTDPAGSGATHHKFESHVVRVPDPKGEELWSKVEDGSKAGKPMADLIFKALHDTF